MKASHAQINATLSKQPLPIALVYGEEPLLVEESADLVRAWARDNGFSEREVYHQDEGISWGEICTTANSLSLFADRKIIEIRMPKGKPDDKGLAIIDYLGNANPDTLLLIIANKIEGSQLKTKWFKAIDAAGMVVAHKKLYANQLGGWLNQRAKQRGLNISPDALELIGERVEGNLLAAKQELDKLELLFGDQVIDADRVLEAVANSARFDLFGFADTVLKGDAKSALRMLDSLINEGIAAPSIIWALHRDINILSQAAWATSKGDPVDKALRGQRVWDSKLALYRGALGRLKGNHLHRLLELCKQADAQAKGAANGDEWHTVRQIVFQVSKPVARA